MLDRTLARGRAGRIATRRSLLKDVGTWMSG
jgi:hypothetical protein